MVDINRPEKKMPDWLIAAIVLGSIVLTMILIAFSMPVLNYYYMAWVDYWRVK